VSFADNTLPLVSLQTTANYTVYGANLSSYEGQVGQLEFTALNPLGFVGIDDIVFSPNAITVTPEPDAVVLMGVGGVLFAGYRRFVAKGK
jgi:hypothetical protein